MSDLTLTQASRASLSRVSAESRWTRRTGLGSRLHNLRLDARMSLADVARDLTSVAYLSRLEADERCPSPALASALARRLRTNLDDLARTETRTCTGLGAELSHADLLLATGQIEDAAWVSADLAEVASGIGETEVAQAALIVHAAALAASGSTRSALRTVRPLARGPLAAVALVAQARFLLDLEEPQRALEVGQRAVDQMTANGRVSFCEAADLAVTMCEAYQAIGRDGFAAHIAYLALKHLPSGDELIAPTGPVRPAQVERALAEAQMTKLCADIDALHAFGPPSTQREARSTVKSTFGTGRRAVS